MCSCAVLLAFVLAGLSGGHVLCPDDDANAAVGLAAYGDLGSSDVSARSCEKRESHETTVQATACCDSDLDLHIAVSSDSRSFGKNRQVRVAIGARSLSSWGPMLRTDQGMRLASRDSLPVSHLSHLRTIVLVV